jgi:hypothetical protein
MNLMSIRKNLDSIINEDGGRNWWNPGLFAERIAPNFPHELKVLKPPPKKDENYNCFIYILGLSNDKTVIKDSRGFIYDTFFQKLINEGIIKETQNPDEGDYILYRNPKEDPEQITHSGLIDGDKVISKWAWGPLIQHSVWDVPASYGDNISYFKKINPDTARELYWDYKEYNKLPE